MCSQGWEQHVDQSRRRYCLCLMQRTRTRKWKWGCLVPKSKNQMLSERQDRAECPILGWLPSILVRAEGSTLPWMNCFSSQHFWHQMSVIFSKVLLLQLSDTTWQSYLSVQFWHNLPGISIRAHKLRAQSWKTTHISMPVTSPSLSPVLLTKQL